MKLKLAGDIYHALNLLNFCQVSVTSEMYQKNIHVCVMSWPVSVNSEYSTFDRFWGINLAKNILIISSIIKDYQ